MSTFCASELFGGREIYRDCYACMGSELDIVLFMEWLLIFSSQSF